MFVTLDQFAQQSIAAGILAKDDLKAFLAALSEDRRPSDGESLARELVREHKLTAFQAQQILLGKAKHLVLGNYQILDRLGQGGMGMVFKAEHRRMARQVALKVLPPRSMTSQDAIKRFQREVQAAAKLMHPNIVAAYDADESRGVHFFVMELVDGSDLSTLVKAQGPLPVNRAVECILQAARGLDFAHQHGVIHRDIKPSNLLIGHDGAVKILDMGLARIESVGGEQAELTGTGQIMGTVDYMAPEQAANTKHADRRSDIYSLGCTLWFLLTGQHLYPGETVIEKLLAHREQPIPSLTAACPGASKQLAAIFQRMVAKNPDKRYANLAAVIVDLERCKVGDSDTPTIDAGPGEDSKFSEFLKGLSTRPSGAAAALSPLATAPLATAPLATAVKPDSSIKPDVHLAGAETVQAADEDDTDRDVASVVNVGPGLHVAPGVNLAPGGNPAPARASAKVAAGSAKTAAPYADLSALSSINWRHPAAIAGLASGALGLTILSALGIWLALSRPDNPPIGPGSPGESAGPIAPGGITAKPGEVVALRLDTGADYVELPGVAFDPARPGTVEFWLESHRTPLGAMPLVLKGRGSILYFQCLGNRRLQLVAAPKLAPVGQDTACKLVIADALPAGRVHLAATWDGAGKYALYVNGKPAAAPQDHRSRFPPFPFSSLGVQPDALAAAVPNQLIDLHDVRVSSRARYRADFEPPDRVTADQATLACYPCTDGAGTRLTDVSAHARHGKIVGAEWIAVSTAASASPADPHRAAALWVQAASGTLRLRIDGQELPLAANEPLPVVAFEVATVDLSATLAADKSGLVNLEPIIPLNALSIASRLVPDDDCTLLSRLSPRDLFVIGTAQREPLTVRFGQTLGACPVAYLGIQQRAVEPGSLAALKDLPNLTSLLLKQCTITPEVLSEVSALSRLTVLNLESSDITDSHLAKLSLPSLKSISLFGSTVTVGGLVEFRTRHPGIVFLGVDALLPMLPPETSPTAPAAPKP